MPTTPRNHLIRIAACAVLPAFAIVGVALAQPSTAPATTVAGVSTSYSPNSPAPALAVGGDPIDVSHSRSTQSTSASQQAPESSPASESDPSSSKPAPSASAASSAPIATPPVQTGPVDTTPAHTANNEASNTETSTPGKQEPTTSTDRVGSQVADQAPVIKGPRRPGRAPLSTTAPTPSSPITSSPTTSAPTTSAPTTSAPTTSAPTTSTPTTSTPTTQVPVSSTSTMEALLFNKINAYRVSHGVAPLKRNATMDAMSRTWSNSMAAAGTLAHNPDMGTQTPSGWTMIGENVAYCGGFSDDDERVAQTLFTLWVNSPGHNANMLDPRYNTGSMGITKAGSGLYFATQNFARF